MVRRFYYPTGRPITKEQLDASLLRLAATFQQLPNCQASRENFGAIAKVIPFLSLTPSLFFSSIHLFIYLSQFLFEFVVCVSPLEFFNFLFTQTFKKMDPPPVEFQLLHFLF